MTTPQLIATLKGQGLTNKDIIELYKAVGLAGLRELARS